MDPSDVANLAIPVLIALAVASRGFRVDEDYVASWVSSAGLELKDESLRPVRRYLTWSRRSRTAGGLIGFLTPVIYTRIVLERPDPGGWSVGLMIVGYLLGALFAEVVLNWSGHRGGSMPRLPRRLGDHLSAYAVVLQRGLGILSAVLVLPYALLEPHARLAVPDPAFVAAVGFAGVCIVGVVEILQRAIIRRPSPSSAADGAVDDAMRSSSVHVLAGAGIALVLNIVGGLTGLLLALAGRAGEVIGLVLLLSMFISSIAVWLDLVKPHGFRVPRPEKQAVTR